MISLIRAVTGGQYGAALSMLGACVERADPSAWQAPVGQFPFWHVAYHALFYTDLYLSASEQAFRPQAFHREDYNFLGQQPWPPYKNVLAERPYDKETLAEYLDTCRTKARLTMDAETEATLAGPSGFSVVAVYPAGAASLQHSPHPTPRWPTGRLAAAAAR